MGQDVPVKTEQLLGRVEHPGRWDQQCKGPGAVWSLLRLQTAAATGRISQAQEGAS